MTRRARTETETQTDVRTAEALEAYEALVGQTPIDPALFTGPFASNVWAGRYAIDGVLGRGGQGTTLAGTDLKTGSRVAVKVFDLSKAKEWKSATLFDREVETLKTVTHPLMPSFLDVISDEGTGLRALVMTHVPGESMHAIVQREGPMSEAALWRLVVDVTSVLGALHGNALVHRDLKPQNILRRPDGTHAVVDFGGVGRVRDAAGSTVVGTFGYMAPEQLYGAQTPATDMYALGATLLSLATGREPEDLPRNGLAFDVERAAPHLSPHLRRLIEHLCAPEPKARPADARALKRELERIADARHAGGERALDTDAVVPPARADVEEALQTVVGVLSVLVGFLGVALAVVVGQILVPLVLTIIASFSSPEQRARFEILRGRVKEAAETAKRGFTASAHQGAKTLEEVSVRHKEREAARRRWRKLQREQRRRRRHS